MTTLPTDLLHCAPLPPNMLWYHKYCPPTCKLHTANWTLQPVNCTHHNILQTANWTLHTVKCSLQTANCNCTMYTADWHIWISLPLPLPPPPLTPLPPPYPTLSIGLWENIGWGLGGSYYKEYWKVLGETWGVFWESWESIEDLLLVPFKQSSF